MVFQNVRFNLVVALVVFGAASVEPANSDFGGLCLTAQQEMDLGLFPGGANLNRLETVAHRIKQAYPQLAERDQREIGGAIVLESLRHEFDPLLILAVIEHESRFEMRAVGPVGEKGLMQIRQETAEWIAKKMKLSPVRGEDLFDPVVNIRVGVAYLAYLKTSFSLGHHYLSAYNMGPLNLRRLLQVKVAPELYKNQVLQKYHGYLPALRKTIARTP